jgi:hypothetical protein
MHAQMQQVMSPSAATPGLASAAGTLSAAPSFTELSAFFERQQDRLKQEVESLRREIKADAPPGPVEAISEQQLAALSERLEAIHAAGLITDAELYALEDSVADFIELKTSFDVITIETVRTNSVAEKLHKLVGLSAGMRADGTFARQLRRKHV